MQLLGYTKPFTSLALVELDLKLKLAVTHLHRVVELVAFDVIGPCKRECDEM